MRKLCGSMLWIMLAATLAAQEMAQKPPASAAPQLSAAPAASDQHLTAYRIEIALNEFDGAKKLNSRAYTMSVVSKGYTDGHVKVGNRVPVTTGMAPGGGVSQFQYMDVGIDMRCRYYGEQDATPNIGCDFDISNLAAKDEITAAEGRPVLRHLSASGGGLLPLGKPTVLSTIDDPTSTHRFQFEVTVNRAK